MPVDIAHIGKVKLESTSGLKGNLLTRSPSLVGVHGDWEFCAPAGSGVECDDRLSSRDPAARNSTAPLPQMPNAHDACAHLSGAHGIWTQHVRMR